MIKAVLHIGTAKTGTTTIQHAFAAHRATLLKNGIAYPTSPGDTNHLALAAYAAPGRRQTLHPHILQGRSVTQFGLDLVPALTAEVRALPPQVHTVVFCSEYCHMDVGTPEAAARLRDLLAPLFSSTRVVVYLRRQADLLTSLYNEYLKNGGTDPDIIATGDYLSPHKLDYARLLEIWGGAFGRDQVTARIFAPGELAGGNVLPDFLTVLGLGHLLPVLDRAPVRNMSLGAPAQEVLRRLNRWALQGGWGSGFAARELCWRLAWRAERDLGGDGRRPTRQAAQAFQRRFDASNERLRAAWFPERTAVFDSDFSRFPEQERPSQPWRDLAVTGAGLLQGAWRARQRRRSTTAGAAPASPALGLLPTARERPPQAPA